jgi:hypothetical protein
MGWLTHFMVHSDLQFVELFLVIGDWRKLHNEELHNLYSSPSIIRVIKSRRVRWVGHVARMGEKRYAYRILVGKPEGKIPLGRPRCRWVDNIKMDHREIGWDGVEWIDMGQDRDQWRSVVNTSCILQVRSEDDYESSHFTVGQVHAQVPTH